MSTDQNSDGKNEHQDDERSDMDTVKLNRPMEEQEPPAIRNSEPKAGENAVQTKWEPFESSVMPDLDAQSTISENIEDLFGHSTEDLSDEERLHLFNKGVEFRKHGADHHALLCYLGCLKDLKPGYSFSCMPQCLQGTAEIYAKFEDYERAVLFIQAAKMYYETAIIVTRDKNSTAASMDSENLKSYKTLDESAISDDAKRANEYEKLSHSCLQNSDIQLALEYCGKATQLRRQCYGESHPISVKSLDLFTVIYAEMGKLQYSQAISKYQTNKAVKTDGISQEASETIKEEKSEIHVKSNISQKHASVKNKVKHVRFAGVQDTDEDKDSVSDTQGQAGGVENTIRTNSTSKTSHFADELFWITFPQLILFFVVSILLAILLTMGWCYATSNPKCPSYSYLYHRIRFYYYMYIEVWFSPNKYF